MRDHVDQRMIDRGDDDKCDSGQMHGEEDRRPRLVGLADRAGISLMPSDDMLGLIVFTLLFGVFMLRIGAKHAETLKSFWQGVFEVMMAMTMFVMRFAPIALPEWPRNPPRSIRSRR